MGLRLALVISLLIHTLIVLAFVSFKPEGFLKNENSVRISLSRIVLKEEPSPKVKKKLNKKRKERAKPVKKKPRPSAEKPKPRKSDKKMPLPEPPPQPPEENTVKEEEKRKRAEEVVEAPEPKTAESPQPHDVSEYPTTYPVGIGEEEDEEEVEELPDYQEEYAQENLSLIREVVASLLRYPPIARRMGWEGTVVVRFYLTPEGQAP